MTDEEFPRSKGSGKTKKTTGSDISEQLLRNLKPTSGKGTTNWLADLTNEALEEEPEEERFEEVSGGPAPKKLSIDMVALVDRIFDLFTQYIFEFNKSVAGTDLMVNCERPVMTKEGDRRYGSRAEAAFQGRLSMRAWSLLMRGTSDRIVGLILPSDQLFGFNADPDNERYGRFITIEAYGPTGDPGWNINGKDFDSEQLPIFAKLGLARLVKVVKGEVSAQEAMTWTGSLSDMQRGQTGETPIDQSGQFTKTVRGIELSPQPTPQRPKSLDANSDSSFPFYTGGQPKAPEFQSAPGSFESPFEPSPAPAPAPAASAPSPATTVERAAQALVDSAPVTMAKAFEIMDKAIDNEVETLAKAGAAAFAAQDLAAAERTLKLTGRVKAFRQKVQDLKAEWEADVKPE